MNERIQELAQQAQLHARQGMTKSVIELNHFDKDVVSERYSKDFEEKFAELIVKECAEVCKSATKEGQPLHLVSIGYADRIKQHFGVKE
jgi:hypothetical protein